MKTVVKITKVQLIDMLKNWSYDPQPVSLQYITKPKLNKMGKDLFGTIIKIANVGGIIGYNYENSVNNQLEREGKERGFLSKPLWNGKGIRISSALSKHNEKKTYYLTYKALQTFKSYYLDNNLNLIPYDQVKSFLPDNTPKNQGVFEGNEIHHREILIDNVIKIKIKKITYEIL